MNIYSNNAKETTNLAKKISKKVKWGVIVLEGELGAGKTTFVRSFIQSFGIRTKVKSPTFNIIKKYEIPKHFGTIYHIDCYRLKDYKEAIPLGIKGIFKTPKSFILVEWAERIKKIIPKKHIKIHIDHVDKNTRKINIVGI